MLILAIVLLVLGILVALLGGFATSMSDAPGQTSGMAPYAVTLLIASAICFALWFGGFHFTLISRGP